VLAISSISTVSLSNDDVEEILEGFEALLVTSDETTGQDVRMTRVIDTGLDALGQGNSTLGSHTGVLLIELWMITKSCGAQVAMLG
jgi:hypothetical protein